MQMERFLDSDIKNLKLDSLHNEKSWGEPHTVNTHQFSLCKESNFKNLGNNPINCLEIC